MKATLLIDKIKGLLEEANDQDTNIWITHPEGVVEYDISDVIVDTESIPKSLLIVPGREF